MLGPVGRSITAAVAISLCSVSASYALPAVDAATTAGKPLVLVNTSKAKRISKKSARTHRSERTAAKARGKADSKASEATSAPAANNEANNSQPTAAASAALPPEIANAHAELTSGDTQSSTAASTLTEADKAAANEAADKGVQIAGADQFNDIDRDLAEQTKPTSNTLQTAALSEGQSPADQNLVSQRPARQSLTKQNLMGHGDAALIGKILIGLGAMMTLASATRMLIA